MTSVQAWGAAGAGKPLGPMTIERREPGPHDVVIDVLFCGVCHSDLHQVRDEWGGALFPMVPGHEVVGRVSRVGARVTKLKVGQAAGVGCMVDSCRSCASCEAQLEQFCEKGAAFTYNSTLMDRKTPTYGGYSTQLVVDEAFALRVPENLDLAAAAPLLCAGITTWSPLMQTGVKAGTRLAVVGLGGLGHMAVKLGASLGAEVTVLSTSAEKGHDAQRLGAKDFVVTKGDGLSKLGRRFDVVLDTVSAPHDYNALLSTLKMRGKMVVVGAPPEPTPVAAFSLLSNGTSLIGSMIGGIEETQQMLDHCGKHGVVSDIERIPVQRINEAYERVLKSDVRYRFVIDLASMRQ